MAPAALLPEPSTHQAALPTKISNEAKLADWEKDLQQNGFAVVKNVIPRDRATSYQIRAYDWLKSFGTDLDFEKPETWIKENLPVQNKINTFTGYCSPHEKFMWDARTEPEILNVFAKIWGTEDLLVSFDSLNITFPNRKDIPPLGAWEHVDQSPFRRGLQCVQGIINLSPSGPNDGGLVIYPGSHKLNDEFLDTQTDQSTWETKDFFIFQKEQLSWFTSRGMHPHKVCADVGDLILWDSRLIHYGSVPTELSNQIRTVIYAAYTPASFATEDVLEKKREIFRMWGGTTHWPHDNIRVRDTKTFLEDGTRDPRDRDQPLEPPEMTDKVLKLAGMKAY